MIQIYVKPKADKIKPIDDWELVSLPSSSYTKKELKFYHRISDSFTDRKELLRLKSQWALSFDDEDFTFVFEKRLLNIYGNLDEYIERIHTMKGGQGSIIVFHIFDSKVPIPVSPQTEKRFFSSLPSEFLAEKIKAGSKYDKVL